MTYERELIYKERIKRLEQENEKLKYYLTMSDEEIQLYIHTIEEEIDKLRQRILKAIKYIKSKLIYDEEELVDILKGEDEK